MALSFYLWLTGWLVLVAVYNKNSPNLSSKWTLFLWPVIPAFVAYMIGKNLVKLILRKAG